MKYSGTIVFSFKFNVIHVLQLNELLVQNHAQNKVLIKKNCIEILVFFLCHFRYNGRDTFHLCQKKKIIIQILFVNLPDKWNKIVT